MIAVLNEDTLKLLVSKANSMGIKREDVIHIQKEDGYYTMVYWNHE